MHAITFPYIAAGAAAKPHLKDPERFAAKLFEAFESAGVKLSKKEQTAIADEGGLANKTTISSLKAMRDEAKAIGKMITKLSSAAKKEIF